MTLVNSCPFNALYWDFLVHHRDHFESNPRVKMMYRNVDRKDDGQIDEIREHAKWTRDSIESV